MLYAVADAGDDHGGAETMPEERRRPRVSARLAGHRAMASPVRRRDGAASISTRSPTGPSPSSRLAQRVHGPRADGAAHRPTRQRNRRQLCESSSNQIHIQIQIQIQIQIY